MVLGVLTFVALYLASLALQRGLRPNETERVTLVRTLSPFDGGRVFANLERFLALGPRPAGSNAIAATRDRLMLALRAAGFAVREHAFDADTPQGPLRMTNLVAVSRGQKPGAVALITHYDTMPADDFVFLGANSSAAGAAWLLEMARVIGPEREGRSVWLVWCDGHEWPDAAGKPGLYGSRALVADLETRGEIVQFDAVIAVSRIGDCYLGIARDPAAPPWLRDLVWAVARDQGYRQQFSASGYAIRDDHAPFREAGVPSLGVIDFSFGGSRLEHDRYWRTAADTLDRVCAESLQAVGDVLYHAISALDRRLEAAAEG